MARLASKALGGFYKTPTHLVPLIAGKIALPSLDRTASYSLMDPCAGKGEAVSLLWSTLVGGNTVSGPKVSLYLCEMERVRAAEAKQAGQSVGANYRASVYLHGDAFRSNYTRSDKEGVSLLYLNPPYDTDPVMGRLEERFLARFTGALCVGGVLVFLVPFYALAASARTLATEYQNLSCFAFPEKDFAVFKQVVLFAEKREAPLMAPDAGTLAQVESWSRGECLATLDATGGAVVTVPAAASWYGAAFKWEMRPVDLSTIAGKVKGWSAMDRRGVMAPIAGYNPLGEPLLDRHYPVAVPPKAAHIATGIAAGVFNGCKVTPDRKEAVLPTLLVKGAFDREWKKVEEKKDKNGNVKGVIEVQQPQLKVTVLDLTTHQFVTLKAGEEGSWEQGLQGMTTGDLLREYGGGLMGALLKQCPVMHDPSREGDNFTLPTMARELYPAQASAARACVTLLGGLGVPYRARKGKAAFLLGEVGSGKSICALTTIKAIGAKRPLILCPPHLLDSWKEQVKLSCPDVTVAVLTDVESVQAWAKDTTPGIALLSRETAKLSHGYEGLTGTCPGCGAVIPTSAEDNVKKRLCCTARTVKPREAVTHEAHKLALILSKYVPENETVNQILGGRVLQRYLLGKKEKPADKAGLHQEGGLLSLFVWLGARLDDAKYHRPFALVASWVKDRDALGKAIFWAYLESYARDSGSYGHEADLRGILRGCLVFVPGYQAIASELATHCPESRGYGALISVWTTWLEEVESQENGEGDTGYRRSEWQKTSEGWVYNKILLGTAACLTTTLEILAQAGKWSIKEGCGERLYQAAASPKRYPLATLISRKYPRAFDFLICDEAHENNSEVAAQAKAAHRLMGLGHPTLCLTGSVMNGYARSLFANLWQVNPSFRAEFDRDEAQAFVDRYGYRKRLVEDRDKDTKEVVEYGSMSDRVECREKMLGETPGVLPLLVLKHLLRCSVTLHKADLQVHIPPCKEERVMVQPSPEQASNLLYLQGRLIDQIRADMFDPGRAGKLWGQLSELPSYLDRATRDVGKSPGRQTYDITYPESMDYELVASVDALPTSTVLPKETWLLDTVEKELAEGRNVMVFAWHVDLLPRLQRLLQDKLGEVVPVLNPDKVTTGKRQAWIEKEVTKKNRRVLIVNPVAVQTGLNSLTHFSTVVWFENPACNPVVYRQANGRIDRIGQTKATRVLFPVYDMTLCSALHKLLLHKVAVSLATDGLDNEATLAAAGLGESTGLTGLSVGKQLYDIITNKVRLRGQDEKYDLC